MQYYKSLSILSPETVREYRHHTGVFLKNNSMNQCIKLGFKKIVVKYVYLLKNK